MSGAPFQMAGTALIVGGIAGIGYGFWRVRPAVIFGGAAACLTGILMIELGQRVPY